MISDELSSNTAEEGNVLQQPRVKQEIIEEPDSCHFVKAKEAALGYKEDFLNIVNIKQEELEAEGEVVSRNAEEPIFMELAWDVMKTFNLTSEGEFFWMPYKVLTAYTQELTERRMKYYLDIMVGESKTRKTRMTAYSFGKQMRGDLQMNSPLITYKVEVINFMGEVVKMEEVYQYQHSLDIENACLRERKFDWVLREPRSKGSRIEDSQRIRALVFHAIESGAAKRNQQRHMARVLNIIDDFNARSEGECRWIPIKVVSATAQKLHVHTKFIMEVYIGQSTSLKTDPPITRSFPSQKLKENARRILYKLSFIEFNDKYELREVEAIRELDYYDKV